MVKLSLWIYYWYFIDVVKFYVSFVYFVVFFVLSLEEWRLINFLVVKSDSSSLVFGEDFDSKKFV